MKGKVSSMWRVAIALVLALSLGLVMAVPAVAEITDAGGDTGTPKLTTFRPQEVAIDTVNSYNVTVKDDNNLLMTSGNETQTVTNAVVINIPQEGGYALWTSTTNINVVLTATGATSNVTATLSTPTDGHGQISAIKVTLADTDNTSGSGANVTAVAVTFDSTSTSTEGIYEWTVGMKNYQGNAATGKANVAVVTEITPPSIVSVTGTAYQNSNDVIQISFSKQVEAATNWSAAFPANSIYCGTANLSLTSANFTPSTGLTETLSITLKEDQGAYLVKGQMLKVTPAENQIQDVNGYAVPHEQKTGDISGDSFIPTVALTYEPNRAVRDADNLTITANFTEAMQASPKITIKDVSDATLVDAEDMSENITSKVWTYEFNVPGGHDGTATVTITGKDLAGNDVGAHTGNTFDIDNTPPTIAVGDIEGTTIQSDNDTIVITFSEPVRPTDNWTNGGEFTSIERDTTSIVTDNATFVIDETETVLTITLNETADGAYLVNGDHITVTPASGNITDAAGNPMSTEPIVGSTSVIGDVAVPTITNIVGDASSVNITLSEAVVPADGSWTSNEFTLIENPAGAPVNISNATVGANNDPYEGMATLLTINLDSATDNASLDTTEAICVTPATGAIVDLAGHAVVATEVCSSSTGAAAPTIESIVGTTIPDAGDTIVITFSEAVEPVTNWPTAFPSDSILCGNTTLALTNADFSPSTGLTENLTITLVEVEGTSDTFLVNGETVKVTPVASQIKDADGNFVASTQVPSTAVVDGDIIPPTIDSIVGWDGTGPDNTDNDTIRIDFSEAVVPADLVWTADGEFTIETANLTDASFDPSDNITTTLIITLAISNELTSGQTLTVTPVADSITDLAGNPMLVESTCSGVVNGGYAIDLVAGWNLISLPLIPTDSTIETVLDDLIAEDTVDQVRTFVWEDSVLTEKYWIPVGPTLTEMEDGQGYWIQMSAPAVLVVGGSELPAAGGMMPSYKEYVGWNLIGFKSLTEMKAEEYLDELKTVMRAMYAYDAAKEIYTVVTGETDLVPGKGYWLAVSAEGTIYP